MSVLKCKMCGGDIEVSADKTFGTCDSCGSTMTFPKVSDDQRAEAFNRGNHFRRIGEFDKALAVYEHLIQDDPSDAEAHWCCALCRFGIEYVEDPATYEYVPTCHRASFDSFTEDVDYLAAVENADGITRRQYQRDGARIADVQRAILATSQKEEPFDVFICYKESDDSGNRTVDSTLAQDIYYQLTDAGLRVFFARITLEDKAGSEYEPYIFAALHSAKAMVVVGTKPEYLNAVWVKNEWSRYLSIVKHDRSKVILPCYKGMNPYELPEQLSVLQSYDMGKIGFIQDLIRGIRKIASAEAEQPTPKETVIVKEGGGASADSLLRRAFMFLEDGDWKSADEYCERVLDQEPENAQAYLGKLMVEQQVRKQDSLKDCSKPFEDSNYYKKALRFADPALAAVIKGYNEAIIQRIIEEVNARQYSEASKAKAEAENESGFNRAAALFAKIKDYRDAAEQEQKCREMAREAAEKAAREQEEAARRQREREEEAARRQREREEEAARQEKARRDEATYADAQSAIPAAIPQIPAVSGNAVVKCIVNALNKALTYCFMLFRHSSIIDGNNTAADRFAQIHDYKDAEEREFGCRQAAAVAETEWAKDKKASPYVVGALAAFLALVILLNPVIFSSNKYKAAVALMNDGEYGQAISAFEKLGNYKDSAAQMSVCQYYQYNAAVTLLNDGKIPEAVASFEKAHGFSDSAAQIIALQGAFNSTNIIAGYGCTVGLKSDGTVVAVGWSDGTVVEIGRSIDVQCNVSDWTDIVAVNAGSHFVGLKSDGTVVAVGGNYDGECNVSGWTDIVAVSSGYSHTIGLKSDGTVVAVGRNNCGQCNISNWTDIVAVSSDSNHTVGLKSDGTVVAVGWSIDGQCNVSDWTDIVAVDAGLDYTVGLKSDGTVVAVGSNEDGQCNVSEWTDIVAISAGGSHTVGLKSDGTVVAVGSNNWGKCNVSGWTDIVAISAGGEHTVGLKSDGTVVAVGNNDDGRCNVSGWKDIKLPRK